MACVRGPLMEVHPVGVGARVGGLFYVGCDAGGFGLGTHQAVDSAVNVSRLVLAYHQTLSQG